MNINFLMPAFLLFQTSLATAAVVSLPQDFPKASKSSLYDLSAEGSAKKLKGLEQLKYFEIRKKSEECNRVAPALFAKNKSLRGWIGLSWLRCNGSRFSEAALDRVAQNEDLFDHGPWRQSLWSLWAEQSLSAIETQVKKKNEIPEKRIRAALQFSERLAKEDRAQLFRYLGEAAQQKKSYGQALFYFQESASLRESSAVSEKIRFLKKALDLPVDGKADKTASAEEKILLPEQQLEERMNNSEKAGEYIAAIKDAMEILNYYPGSRVSKRLKDKPLEIYNLLSDHKKDGDPAVTDKALDVMGEGDPGRLVEWAQSLHRRADYAGALVLSERALNKLSNSTQATSLLWIAGRSAHFLGQYEKAMKFFDELALRHRGTDEASEALFRMGLIQYRLHNDSMAVVLFEKTLATKKDRYDSSSRYWMYRSLAREQSTRATQVRQDLIDLYPFSYYGIRLRAEMNNNKVSWPEVTKQDSAKAETAKNNLVVWLEGAQNDSWKRFSELVKNGWLVEAQVEFQDFPKPEAPVLQALVGQKLAEVGLSSIAIRWLNEAMEQDKNLRSKDFLSAGFPDRFKDIYVKEAARNDLSARLSMSLTRQESAFNPRAVSSSNAMGLMQLIPPTAREVAQKLGLKKIELPEDLFRPEVNVAMGSFYIADMIRQFKSVVPFALAAYNAGPSRLNLWIAARPEISSQLEKISSAPEDEIWFDELPWSETSFYVKAILRNTLLYRLIQDGDYDLSPVVWSDLVSKKALE